MSNTIIVINQQSAKLEICATNSNFYLIKSINHRGSEHYLTRFISPITFSQYFERERERANSKHKSNQTMHTVNEIHFCFNRSLKTGLILICIKRYYYTYAINNTTYGKHLYGLTKINLVVRRFRIVYVVKMCRN